MDDVQGHVEYAEVIDPQYFSPEHKGWYSYIKDQVGTILKVYKHETKQMINTRTYDTFGNLISQTGSSNGNLGYQSKKIKRGRCFETWKFHFVTLYTLFNCILIDTPQRIQLEIGK